MSDVVETERKGWLARLRGGLAKSTKRVTESITGLFTKKKLDQATLDELEDALIQADLGVAVAARLVEKLGRERFGKEVTDEEVRTAFADDIAEILQPVATSLVIDPAHTPHVVLVIGVNGSGKTTTIAKLAHLFKGEGRKVMLAAGDTFRAAAVEQLKVWGERAGVPVIAKEAGADAAGLAYEALATAKAERCDVLVVTKLDGSAKGGVLVALAERFKLPVVAIGVGEGIDDLRPFEARAFARSLMGLPS